MAQEDRNRLAEWFTLIREHVPALRQRMRQWVVEAHEEPSVLWQTPAVRYSTYVTGGLVLAWIIQWGISLAVPPPPASARPEATTADFHVLCANPACGYHFVVQREFGFSDFPIPCPRCSQETGQKARLCTSDACRGRWVAPTTSDGEARCPRCERRFEKY